jgi:homoserine kinase type II
MIDRLALWDMQPGRIRSDIELPGSPRRCLRRIAVEDAAGRVWMLEQLRPGQFEHRERVAGVLARLEQAGLSVPAYVRARDGRYVARWEKGGAEHGARSGTGDGAGAEWYQLSPYVPGDSLPQPDFVDHAERGQSLGTFLADLREAGASIRELDDVPRFRLEEYTVRLMAVMARRNPREHEVLLPVLPVLAPLFEAWDDLPHTLNHGDYHPLNVIWRGRSAVAVIDWEFCGIRPALYDAANCLGCVGIEDPRCLTQGLALHLLRTLRDRGCLEGHDADGFSLLPGLVLGLRFAWMSEWLRRKDHEMIELELRYMRLLANSIDTLLPAWRVLLAD